MLITKTFFNIHITFEQVYVNKTQIKSSHQKLKFVYKKKIQNVNIKTKLKKSHRYILV